MKKNPAQIFKDKKVLFFAIFIISLTGFIIGLICCTASIFLPGRQKQFSALKPQITTSPTPTPRPSPPPAPIAQGKQIYNVSQGSGSKGPGMRQLVVDPFDPKKGENQTMSVKVQNKKPVTIVSIILKTDTKATTYQLKLKEGKDTDGLWEGSWTTDDTHDYVYTAVVSASDTIESAQVTLSFR